MTDANENSASTVTRRIADQSLEDGTVLDLVSGGDGCGQPLLAIREGELTRSSQRFLHGSITYEPIRLQEAVSRAIRLPAGVMEHRSTRELFGDISAYFARLKGLSARDVALLAYFAFATWLADCLPTAPLLWIVVRPTASREALLNALKAACRRPLLLDEITLRTLAAVPTGLRPTVITQISRVTPALLKGLRASSRQGTCAGSAGKLHDFFCAKIILSNEPPPEISDIGLPVEIAIHPTGNGAHGSLIETSDIDTAPDELQKKLLNYRFLNLRKVAEPHLAFDEFTAPVQELARQLAMCIVGDPVLQSRIPVLLRDQDRELRVDRTLSAECVVIEGVLAACHQSLRTLPVGDLTQTVNTILAGRGQTLQLSPEQVGWKLRALGLHTDFVAGGRKGLKLSMATRMRIHELAQAHQVRSVLDRSTTRDCTHCEAVLTAAVASG